jgi:hypothetical protein
MAAAKVPSRRDRWDYRDVRSSRSIRGRYSPDSGIRPGDGIQVGHQTLLARWTAEGLVPARAGYPGAAPA